MADQAGDDGAATRACGRDAPQSRKRMSGRQKHRATLVVALSGTAIMGIMMGKTTRFDAADYLDTEERQVAYIAAALETGDADFTEPGG
jgi:hypothetical protein